MLEDTYRAALARTTPVLDRLKPILIDRPAVYVGSGGALAVARLGADAHQRVTGHLAKAVSSLEFAANPPRKPTAIVVVSAGARHPDTAAAVTAAISSGCEPVVLITEREPDSLTGPLADPTIRVVQIPPPTRRDGFLATNSVINLGVALARLYHDAVDLPAELALGNAKYSVSSLKENCLVLYGPDVAAAAVDLETRLSETGLSAAQVADYRNFAHGRHLGLSRNLDRTLVVALSGVESAELAAATIAKLPPELEVIRISSRLSGPAATLDALAGTMTLVGVLAAERQLNLAKPKVPFFGRELYHLRGVTPPSATNSDPVAWKLAEANLLAAGMHVRKLFQEQFDEWRSVVSMQRFAGLVLDYDGTVCTTADRFELPEEPVREALLQLLNDGLALGFASGRGMSLYRDLLLWVPREHWQSVVVGMYNGSLLTKLSDVEPPVPPLGTGSVFEVLAEVLAKHALSEYLLVDARHQQISVGAAPGSGIPRSAITALIRDLLWQHPDVAGDLKQLSSAHSEDVVPKHVSKTAVVDAIAQLADGEVLAIGDQGQADGNDYEMLARHRWTLTVDRCSADPGRCWNLRPGRERGPSLLVHYLRNLKPSRGGFSFKAT